MDARTWVKRGLVGMALPCLAAGSVGCRSRGEVNSSTVAKDRSLSPRGQVIPPAGFGVDLVTSPPSRADQFLRANQDRSVEAAKTR